MNNLGKSYHFLKIIAFALLQIIAKIGLALLQIIAKFGFALLQIIFMYLYKTLILLQYASFNSNRLPTPSTLEAKSQAQTYYS